MANTQNVTILLVEDNERFREGLRTLLNFYSSNCSLLLEVVGEANSLAQVLKFTQQKSPDLILLDLQLIGSDGITVLVNLKESAYMGKVLVLSAHQEDEWIFRAMQAGASGYVFKNHLATQLSEAISTVIRSEIYLPSEVASRFFRFFQASSDSCLRACHQLHLTQREQEVLYWLTQGASNEEIAKHLYVTVATVKAHLTSVFEKLKVNSRTQAIVTALKLGLVKA
ncbi:MULTISPECIES: response regulator [Cyanophyceae]|jgi:DNA-binding NarL/FixJ family response regulator|uniref:response regulator n=1 Tax=Cyanophyceae TaxID=3028117 RepID=UPI00232FB6CD|nr:MULTISPECIES: response regulator transcription factor [Cyanophyceae]MDB9355763.1 response regulator transcription factor [Nodularia spumigena CS-587/03]MDB9341346.1 response regulator transcription factor [Nodularia spumigena CS-589/07]MDB9399167.1 response regulator transcription factor [Microcystis aeruginosa CS-567/02-A1]MDB9500198.1 response regulator transcription factor [Nodularia spumigena CS-336/02]MDB9533464.1 response regulator transcription factor [Nodularia spumigena CS-1038]